MEKNIETIIFLLAYYTLVYLLIKVSTESGYEQGQIDAINGKIKFKLQTDDNGETKFTKIDAKTL